MHGLLKSERPSRLGQVRESDKSTRLGQFSVDPGLGGLTPRFSASVGATLFQQACRVDPGADENE